MQAFSIPQLSFAKGADLLRDRRRSNSRRQVMYRTIYF
jgi:hypothetical protein